MAYEKPRFKNLKHLVPKLGRLVADYFEGLSHEKLAEFDRLMEHSLNLFPGDPYLWHIKGNFEEERGEATGNKSLIEQAAKSYASGLRASPSNSFLLMSSARVEYVLENFWWANELIIRLLRTRSDTHTLRLAVKIKRACGEDAEADVMENKLARGGKPHAEPSEGVKREDVTGRKGPNLSSYDI